jgi:glycerophosphoryl diester phosphodiesterase
MAPWVVWRPSGNPPAPAGVTPSCHPSPRNSARTGPPRSLSASDGVQEVDINLRMTPLLSCLDHRPRPLIMAHRGNRILRPENTLAAFRQAIEDGADILETDLRLTADEAFVCLHDPNLDRTTDGRGPVDQVTLHDLRRLKAGPHHPSYAGARIPTLEDLMDLLPDDVALALELKSDRFLDPAICRRLAAELASGGVRDRSMVLSFSRARLQAMGAIAADLPVGWITLRQAWPASGFDLLGPFWPLMCLNPLYVLVAHRRGQWTCPLDPLPDQRLWLYRAMGCDAVLTDHPGNTAKLLGRPPRRLRPG